jgi:hypothetical protein
MPMTGHRRSSNPELIHGARFALRTSTRQPGRTFVGVLATMSLLVAGEGAVYTNESGRRVALLRAYDKRTGEDAGAVEMPKQQPGSPMTDVVNGLVRSGFRER